MRRARTIVAAAGLAALAGKLVIAATTAGTNDVRIFAQFAQTIGRVGPVQVYGVSRAGSMVYNHGPLTGLMLDFLNSIRSWNISFPLLIRAPACLADLVTCLLVFELARARMGVRRATWCGVAVALSPVLVGVSGFHGNTDPVFVCLVLLSAWLLTSRQRMVSAGVCLGLALSVKIVPAVVVPVLAVAAFRHSRRSLALFLLGFAAVIAALWGAPLVEHYDQVKANVLDYAGVPYRGWGIPRLGPWVGIPSTWLHWWEGPGRFSVVVVSAGLGSFLAWRRPGDAGAAVGLTLAATLLFSTASADQYLAWPAAAIFLVDFWSALAYNLIAGAFLTELYARWSGGFPWGLAVAQPWTWLELLVAAGAWAVLAVSVVQGTRLAFHGPAATAEPAPTRSSRAAPLPSSRQ